MTETFQGIDLDQERTVRAAEREGANEPWPIRFGGQIVAVLPVELPLSVIAPLREIDDTIALVLRQAMALATNNDAASKWEASELVVDMLASSPDLPVKVLTVIEEISKNLLTEEGLGRFLDQRPSIRDIVALAKGVLRYYGISLGEASASSDSSTDGGGTSNTTSSQNLDSTPEESSPQPESLAS
jgi:hypothetical protein